MRVSGIFCLVFFFSVTLAAGIFGGEPYEKWEEGGYGYLVMGDSLIADQVTLFGEEANRQGDTCRPNGQVALKAGQVPSEAVVETAYFVWTGAVDPAKLDDPTDQTVLLEFYREDGYDMEMTVGGLGLSPKYLGDTSDPFLFDSVRFSAEVRTGCSETVAGTPITAELGYFTYRVEVTDFFTQIQMDNELSADPMLPGAAIAGDYLVSGLDCTDDDVYRCSGLMVSNWALVIVYRSAEVTPKNIYLYPGFSFKKDETADVTFAGLDLSSQPVMRMTMLSSEGDPALVDAQSDFELITMRDQEAQSFILLTGDCDPQDDVFNEVWDSRRSSFIYNAEKNKYCTTYDAPLTFGLDIDEWYLDAAADEHLAALLPEGTSEMTLHFTFNSDEVLTNLMILAVESKSPSFDIPVNGTDWPDGREKHRCSCLQDPDDRNRVCKDRPFYYLIKVQNWGNDTAHDVMVVDDPVACNMLFYVPDSTEMATQFDENGNGTDWTPIPDGPDGTLPLAGEGYKVAETMAPCDIGTMTCSDTRMIRFKVDPNGLPKNCLIENIAYIKEAASAIRYATNNNLPLMSMFGECRSMEECPEPSKEECGGVGEPPVNDDDAIDLDEDTLVSDDTVVADEEPTTDDTTLPDADTEKDGGCGCSLVF